MTFQERAEAIAGYGFTGRQAEFLTTVMLHAGVCLPRQYTKFCGIVFGQNTRDFFAKLTARRYATAHACWRRGGTFYHIHHKGLYRAIGERDNRHRRRPTIPRVAERLAAFLPRTCSVPTCVSAISARHASQKKPPNGQAVAGVAAQLNAEGERNRSGREWTPQMVHHVLKSAAA